MKKLILLVLALMLCASALAEVDLSGLTFDELVDLRDRAQRAMWDCEEWQEVTVPQGIWRVGEDIPFGHWTVTPAMNTTYGFTNITYCGALDETGSRPKVPGGGFYYAGNISIDTPEHDGYMHSLELNLQNEGYLIIEYGDVIFTPYAGHPDLGFKKP